MKTAVMTDTNSGMTVEEGQKLGVFVLPMPVIIDGKDYMEGVDITSQQLFTALRQKQIVSTSQPSPQSVTDMWDAILTQGYDDLVYIPMSSGLSGSCHTAIGLSEDYHGRVCVADTHRISLTQKLAVLDAKHMADTGMNAAEIYQCLEENGMNAMIYIAVDTLEYLKRSGRVNAAAAAIATVMNIKPILRIAGDKLEAFAKIRGIQRCQQKMIETLRNEVETQFSAYPKDKLVIGTAGSFETPADEEAWRSLVQAAFPEFTVPYVPLSCSISSHTGINARGLAVIVRG
ncbi:MAG: DegV family protein [Oscillospiraceae bacterium]|nr:DegV family protein [Oscillospiraceae bacterium]